MDTNQNVSKAEWLCAALIDFLPIVIIQKLFVALVNFVRSFSYVGTDWENGSFSLREPISMDLYTKVNIGLVIFGLVYLLFKDAFGLSLGKRIMGIKLQRNGAEPNVLWCILRNVVLAVCYSKYLLYYLTDITNYVVVNLFTIYCIVELACVYFTNRTIGDNICQLKMAKKDDFTPGKINNRTYCIGTIIILFFMVGYMFTDLSVSWIRKDDYVDVDLIKKTQLIRILCSTLMSILVYSFLFYKLIKPKAFRWTVIVLFALFQLGYVSYGFIFKSF